MIGEKLKAIRYKRGYTLRQLEKLSGVSHGFLCDIEHDRSDPSIETLHKIANALEIEPAYFLNNKSDASKQADETA